MSARRTELGRLIERAQAAREARDLDQANGTTVGTNQVAAAMVADEAAREADDMPPGTERDELVRRHAEFIANDVDYIKREGRVYETTRGWESVPSDATMADLHDYFDANVGWSDSYDALPFHVATDVLNLAGELVNRRNDAREYGGLA